jgi:hypothetical protein
VDVHPMRSIRELVMIKDPPFSNSQFRPDCFIRRSVEIFRCSPHKYSLISDVFLTAFSALYQKLYYSTSNVPKPRERRASAQGNPTRLDYGQGGSAPDVLGQDDTVENRARR